MVFSSLNFIFIFLPIVVVVYYIFSLFRQRGLCNFVLLIFSLFFYACSSPKHILLLLVSIVINYISGIMCGKEVKRRKLWLCLGIGLNLCLLFYFKYVNFFMDNASSLLGLDITYERIVLPVGISFFTFQGMSYVVDVYKGASEPQKNIFKVALYISLFPQLIAGPIVRYSEIEKDLSDRRESIRLVYDGLMRFILGLGKKVIIADCMGLVADRIFDTDFSLYSVSLAWVGVIAYTLQIYFDFSGYSDMAIGLGRIFGFHFPENFNYPYISRSITEFWRRWHMSLSAWFRDYVYIPLGGNRCSVFRHIINIAIVWVLTGFWHGASWNFIVWGGYFALILICEKYIWGTALGRLPKALRHIYALLLIVIGWGIFCKGDLTFSVSLLKNMFFAGGCPLINGDTLYYILEYRFEFLLAIVGCLPISEMLSTFFARSKRLAVFGTLAQALFGLCVFGISIGSIVSSSFSPFIYFRF